MNNNYKVKYTVVNREYFFTDNPFTCPFETKMKYFETVEDAQKFFDEKAQEVKKSAPEWWRNKYFTEEYWDLRKINKRTKKA